MNAMGHSVRTYVGVDQRGGAAFAAKSRAVAAAPNFPPQTGKPALEVQAKRRTIRLQARPANAGAHGGGAHGS